MLKDEWFIRLWDDDSAINDIMTKISRAPKNLRDPEIIRELQNPKSDWTERWGTIFRKGSHENPRQEQRYVPQMEVECEEIMEIYHSWGHPGIEKTQEIIQRDFWWPQMKNDLTKYIKACQKCQRAKPDRTKRAAPLHPHNIPEGPWEVISVDLMGPLPESQGYDMIMVVVDRFSKYAYFLPTNATVTSKGIARLFINHVFRDHGFPIKVISDRGTQFVSRFMKELYGALGIKGNPSTAYHPQTDGQTEHVNQEVKEFLTIFVNNKQDDWSEWLPIAQFCHNDRQHSATKHSPFFLNYGRHPRKGIEPLPNLTVPAVETLLKNMTNARDKASVALKEAAERMKIQYNKNRQQARQYKKGDKVYINAEHLPTQRASKKLDQKYYGPYEVVEAVGPSAYRIRIPASWRTYNVFNEILLKPYHAPHYPRQKAIEKEKRDEQEGEATENEYEVEDLLDSRISKKGRGRLEYLVKWKNYPREDASWEPKDNLANAQEIVDEFHKKFPNAPRRIRKNDLELGRRQIRTRIPGKVGTTMAKMETERLTGRRI